jgi:hypothetical protein
MISAGLLRRRAGWSKVKDPRWYDRSRGASIVAAARSTLKSSTLSWNRKRPDDGVVGTCLRLDSAPHGHIQHRHADQRASEDPAQTSQRLGGEAQSRGCCSARLFGLREPSTRTRLDYRRESRKSRDDIPGECPADQQFGQ